MHDAIHLIVWFADGKSQVFGPFHQHGDITHREERRNFVHTLMKSQQPSKIVNMDITPQGKINLETVL